jgi:glycine/D-amino acid oxidase-like deaminating enzyme
MKEESSLRYILNKKIPFLSDGKFIYATTCLYTIIQDDHFLIDFHPQFPEKNVLLISCCSGHGFKFTSVIGELVVDLLTKQTTSLDISMFKLHAGRY